MKSEKAKVGSDVLVYPTELILTHVLPHLDEAVATWLVRKFGETVFPGAKKADIRFVERAPNAPPAFLQKSRYLYIGLCENKGPHSIDEHREVSRTAPDGRVPGECAATLAAKRIGLKPEEHSSLWCLLREVYRCDSKGGVKYTQLAEIMKLLGRIKRGGSGQILEMIFPALDAILEYHMMSLAPVPEEMTLSELFSEYVTTTKMSDTRIIKDIDKWIMESHQRSDGSVTELAYVVKAMYRTGRSKKDIFMFCSEVFEAWEYDQVEFYEMLPVIDKSLKKWIRVKVDDIELPRMSAVIVRSDSYSALRAANFRQFRLVVIQNTCGNVQVFVNGKVSDRISLDTFAGMVRLLETPVSNRRALKNRILAELVKEGVGGLEDPRTIAEACWNRLRQTKGEYQALNWYYHYTQGGVRSLLNGSHTHPSIKPTSVGLDMLVDALECAFHPGLINRWIRDINDPFDLLRPSVSKPVSQPKPVLQIAAHSSVTTGSNMAIDVERDLDGAFAKTNNHAAVVA